MRARRPWAWPLVPLYAAAHWARTETRKPGPRLGWPVVSVGSISAGGAGKTPVVIALARLLVERGWSPDVLSRGYGRTGRAAAQVNLETLSAAEQFGDEPVLLAQRSNAPVWVCGSRYAAGRAAELAVAEHSIASYDASTKRVHLLDDGFQHRQLPRDFDLVLVTTEDLQDAMLPAGNRREPFSALLQADAVALREEEAEELAAPLRQLTRDNTPQWTVRRTLRFPGELGVFSAGLRPLAFCAIARPDDFVGMLRRSGCGVIDAVTFRDHARYGEHELSQIIRFAHELRATGLVTTEKDAVKLDAAARSRLQEAVGPVVVVELQAEFIYSSPVIRAIEARLHKAANVESPA